MVPADDLHQNADWKEEDPFELGTSMEVADLDVRHLTGKMEKTDNEKLGKEVTRENNELHKGRRMMESDGVMGKETTMELMN